MDRSEVPEKADAYSFEEIDPQQTIEAIVPGTSGLPGDPDWEKMPSLFARTIGQRLPESWREVATMTIGELLDFPSVGVGKVEGFLEYLSHLVQAPPEPQPRTDSQDLNARVAATVENARQTLISIVTEATRWGTPDLLAALEEALAADSPVGIRNQLHSISVPAVEPEDWIEDLRSVRSALDERSFEILDERVLTDSKKGRPTLQELADRYEITRERVRQLESKALDILERETQGAQYLALKHAVNNVQRLGTAFPLSELPLDRSDAEERRLLFWVAGPFKRDGAWVVLDEYGSVRDLAQTAFDRVATGGIAPRFDYLESLFDLGVTRDHLEEVASTLTFQEVDDTLILPAETLGERAVQRLTVVGRPMTMDELFEGEAPGKNQRSFANAVQASEEIVRTGRDRYELAEWGGSKYSGIVPAMVERLRSQDPEPIAIDDLAQELVERFGVSANSIHMYATMDPKFLAEKGRVRLRPADIPYEPDVDLANTSACYLIEGNWSLRMPVDKDLARGSGRGMPEAFAVHLGLQPSDAKGQLHGPFGEISVGWAMYPWVGSLRREAQRLGLVEGDFLFMRRVSATSVEFAGSRIGPDADAVAKLRSLIGVETSSRDWRYDLAEAVGVGAATEPDAQFLLRRLRRRGDDDLAELVEVLID